MSEPRIVLCTLLLNEMEHLPRLYEQHRNWPGLVRWVFVEAADFQYAKVNPHRVSDLGLSVDGTPSFLYGLMKNDDRIRYVPHGMSFHRDPAQGKCAARNRYLRAADDDRPDFLVVVDADEFYPHEMQARINAAMASMPKAWGYCFRHREIWHPPSMAKPMVCDHCGYLPTPTTILRAAEGTYYCVKCENYLYPNPLSFSQEVVGGFWNIPYARCWRWFEGLEYADNHNTPSRPKYGALDRKLARHDKDESAPYFVHMAFASRLQDRAAKHRYYEARGEAVDRKRKWYTESRAAYETWQPGDSLPHGAKVVPYTGIVPECFRGGDDAR